MYPHTIRTLNRLRADDFAASSPFSLVRTGGLAKRTL